MSGGLEDILGGIFGALGAQVAHESPLSPISMFVQTSKPKTMGVGAPLAPLSPPSTLASDAYDLMEREAIQEESELPPFTPEELDFRVPGLDDEPDVSLAVHHQNALRAAGCVDTTPPPASDSRAVSGPVIGNPAQPVCCGDCAEFEPGSTHYAGGIGKCARTADGLPPVASRGYGVCFPDAPRQCPQFQPSKED